MQSGFFLSWIITAPHKPELLYEYYEAAIARSIIEKLEFHRTPVHASWLNAVEPELGILERQCLKQRIPTLKQVKSSIHAWQKERNREYFGLAVPGRRCSN